MKVPNKDLIDTVVAMKRPNPGWGCPRIASSVLASAVASWMECPVPDVPACDPLFQFHQWKANLRVLSSSANTRVELANESIVTPFGRVRIRSFTWFADRGPARFVTMRSCVNRTGNSKCDSSREKHSAAQPRKTRHSSDDLPDWLVGR
jgi:hypothetical protein